MTGPRAVRIPRARAVRPAVRPAAPADLLDHRPNRAGTQRAVRTTLLYVVAVAVLTAVLTDLDLSSAEGTRPVVLQGLELFLGVAVALVIGSAVFALTPAPRSVEVGASEVVVVGRWGRRRSFGPLETLAPHVLKHFADGILSTRSVDMVEVSDPRGRRYVYQVESGLFDPGGDAGSTP